MLQTSKSSNSTDVDNPTGSSEVYIPYVTVITVTIWVLQLLAYLVCKWRRKAKSVYVIPRVFVLCSPRTVQYHYELILRVGLPSYDFNPDKHDLDVTILGQQKNEVVPMTRLNTKTLLDEPLITNLSIIVYRLVEMPILGALELKHSGPFKAWIYAYDFTVIDLSTNREYYYALNSYISSFNKIIPLSEPNNLAVNVEYPIDDVPLPQWTVEDIFLALFTTTNWLILSVSWMPTSCHYGHDILSVFVTAMGAGTLLFFLDWLLYYYLRWNQDRQEYFNEPESCKLCPGELSLKICLLIMAASLGGYSIYLSLSITDWTESLVWFLVLINSSTVVIGFWNMFRHADLAGSIVALGLRLRGIELVSVGMKYSDMMSDIRTKSASASDDGNSNISMASKLSRGVGPRSSVKSFGFDAVNIHASALMAAKLQQSRVSSTGATPNNHPTSSILRPVLARHNRSHSPQQLSRMSHHSSNLSKNPPKSTITAQPSNSHSKSESEKRKLVKETTNAKIAK